MITYLRVILFCFWVLLCGAIVWLVLGRRILLCIDRFFLIHDRGLPDDPLEIRQSEFIIGRNIWPFPRTETDPFEIKPDGQNRLTLITGGTGFTFGPIVQKTMADNSGTRLDFTFQPDPGDIVSMTQSHSRLVWVEPFQLNIMGGPVSYWRRHLYDRLHWKKSTG